MLSAERELELELEQLMAALGEGHLEGETPANPAIIAFKIPEAPYSDETFKLVHKSIDIFEAIHATISIFGPKLLELLGAVGLGMEVLAPLAGFVGTMFALGSGYAEARAVISRQRIRSGFALGVVTGADGRTWPYVKRLFWEFAPEVNTFDQAAGKIAQQAFNMGLATGYLQGKQIAQNPAKMRFFWDSMRNTLSQGDRMQFAGDSKSWPEQLWRAWYLRVMSSFIALYLKD
jgi:hypothetical protein